MADDGKPDETTMLSMPDILFEVLLDYTHYVFYVFSKLFVLYCNCS